jgi:hypothetical protein
VTQVLNRKVLPMKPILLTVVLALLLLPAAAGAAPLPAPSPHGAVSLKVASANAKKIGRTLTTDRRAQVVNCKHTVDARGHRQPGSQVCTVRAHDKDGTILRWWVQTVDTGGGHLVYGQVDKPNTKRPQHATGLIYP